MNTALSIAVLNGRNKCLDFLINKGAHVNKCDKPLLREAATRNHIETVQLLLHANIKINQVTRDEMTYNSFPNVLQYSIAKSDPKEPMCMLLYAAGETIDGTTIETSPWHRAPVPEYLLHKDLDLRHLCRETIRKHLLHLDPHQHLFHRVAHLGLPSVLTKFVLYDVTLDYDAITSRTTDVRDICHVFYH